MAKHSVPECDNERIRESGGGKISFIKIFLRVGRKRRGNLGWVVEGKDQSKQHHHIHEKALHATWRAFSISVIKDLRIFKLINQSNRWNDKRNCKVVVG